MQEAERRLLQWEEERRSRQAAAREAAHAAAAQLQADAAELQQCCGRLESWLATERQRSILQDSQAELFNGQGGSKHPPAIHIVQCCVHIERSSHMEDSKNVHGLHCAAGSRPAAKLPKDMWFFAMQCEAMALMNQQPEGTATAGPECPIRLWKNCTQRWCLRASLQHRHRKSRSI